MCHKVLKMTRVMEAVLGFVIGHAAPAPQSDMEWVAVKGRELLVNFTLSVKDAQWRPSPVGPDRCVFYTHDFRYFYT